MPPLGPVLIAAGHIAELPLQKVQGSFMEAVLRNTGWAMMQ